ncbi:MAG: hypothetical protein AAGG46_08880, partial [Planctomycetota bacterium]
PAGESAGISFPLADTPPGKLRASIAQASLTAAGDALAIDNTAYAALNSDAPGRVLLVGRGNTAVETALATGRATRFGQVETLSPAALQSKDHQALAASGVYDLIIYDRCAPETMPRANTLFIGSTPPLDAWKPTVAAQEVGEASATDIDAAADPAAAEPEWINAPIVLDWNRSHPLLSYVELSNLLVARALKLTPPPTAAQLIDSDSGPLLAVAPRDSYEDAVLALPILAEEEGATVANTNWFTKRSFPTFWLNVLEYFVGEAGAPGRSQTAPGRPIELRLTSDVQQVTVVTPTGERETLTRVGDEPFQYQRTDTPGVYEVVEQRTGGGERVAQRFAVNLFNRDESDIRLRPRGANDPEEAELGSLRIGFVDVQATAGAAPERKELWRLLLVAALGLLLLEWYVYNRRVYV